MFARRGFNSLKNIGKRNCTNKTVTNFKNNYSNFFIVYTHVGIGVSTITFSYLSYGIICDDYSGVMYRTILLCGAPFLSILPGIFWGPLFVICTSDYIRGRKIFLKFLEF